MPTTDARDRDMPESDADDHTTTPHPDGSVTVVGPDGSSLTYCPVQFGAPDSSSTPSQGAVMSTSAAAAVLAVTAVVNAVVAHFGAEGAGPGGPTPAL
jgi:hypothetical protein